MYNHLEKTKQALIDMRKDLDKEIELKEKDWVIYMGKEHKGPEGTLIQTQDRGTIVKDESGCLYHYGRVWKRIEKQEEEEDKRIEKQEEEESTGTPGELDKFFKLLMKEVYLANQELKALRVEIPPENYKRLIGHYHRKYKRKHDDFSAAKLTKELTIKNKLTKKYQPRRVYSDKEQCWYEPIKVYQVQFLHDKGECTECTAEMLRKVDEAEAETKRRKALRQLLEVLPQVMLKEEGRGSLTVGFDTTAWPEEACQEEPRALFLESKMVRVIQVIDSFNHRDEMNLGGLNWESFVHQRFSLHLCRHQSQDPVTERILQKWWLLVRDLDEPHRCVVQNEWLGDDGLVGTSMASPLDMTMASDGELRERDLKIRRGEAVLYDRIFMSAFVLPRGQMAAQMIASGTGKVEDHYEKDCALLARSHLIDSRDEFYRQMRILLNEVGIDDRFQQEKLMEGARAHGLESFASLLSDFELSLEAEAAGKRSERLRWADAQKHFHQALHKCQRRKQTEISLQKLEDDLMTRLREGLEQQLRESELQVRSFRTHAREDTAQPETGWVFNVKDALELVDELSARPLEISVDELRLRRKVTAETLLKDWYTETGAEDKRHLRGWQRVMLDRTLRECPEAVRELLKFPPIGHRCFDKHEHWRRGWYCRLMWGMICFLEAPDCASHSRHGKRDTQADGRRGFGRHAHVRNQRERDVESSETWHNLLKFANEMTNAWRAHGDVEMSRFEQEERKRMNFSPGLEWKMRRMKKRVKSKEIHDPDLSRLLYDRRQKDTVRSEDDEEETYTVRFEDDEWATSCGLRWTTVDNTGDDDTKLENAELAIMLAEHAREPGEVIKLSLADWQKLEGSLKHPLRSGHFVVYKENQNTTYFKPLAAFGLQQLTGDCYVTVKLPWNQQPHRFFPEVSGIGRDHSEMKADARKRAENLRNAEFPPLRVCVCANDTLSMRAESGKEERECQCWLTFVQGSDNPRVRGEVLTSYSDHEYCWPRESRVSPSSEMDA